MRIQLLYARARLRAHSLDGCARSAREGAAALGVGAVLTVMLLPGLMFMCARVRRKAEKDEGA